MESILGNHNKFEGDTVEANAARSQKQLLFISEHIFFCIRHMNLNLINVHGMTLPVFLSEEICSEIFMCRII